MYLVSSAEQAASIVTTPPNFTFENPAKLWDATDKELTDAQKARFALGPDSLAEMHQSVVDTYLGWMAVGTADEWRLIADGNVHTLLTGLISKRDRAKPRVNQAVKSYLTAAMQRVISEPTLEP